MGLNLVALNLPRLFRNQVYRFGSYIRYILLVRHTLSISRNRQIGFHHLKQYQKINIILFHTTDQFR